MITLAGVTQSASIDSDSGDFSAVFDTHTLASSASPYTITFFYAGDANFLPASAMTFLTVNSTTAPATTSTSPANPVNDNNLVKMLNGNAGGANLVPPTSSPFLVQPAPAQVQANFFALSFRPIPQGFGAIPNPETPQSSPNFTAAVELEPSVVPIQPKPFTLSSTEGNSDGSSVERLYTDFLGPAPPSIQATREGDSKEPAPAEAGPANASPESSEESEDVLPPES